MRRTAREDPLEAAAVADRPQDGDVVGAGCRGHRFAEPGGAVGVEEVLMQRVHDLTVRRAPAPWRGV
ncbi:hypothetical protein [Streptomyces narbonensis]